MSGTIANGTILPGAGPVRAGRGAVVVLDAAGVIGRGLVAATLEAGHAAIAVDRDLAALAALSAQYPRAALVAVPGSARDETDARELARALRALERPLSAVLTVVDAGRLRGRLLDQSVETTCAALLASLAPQLAAARHLLPLLAQAESDDGDSRFVLIGGPGGRHPWAGYGQRSLTEAAMRMLARVLHDEARALGVRLQLLSVDTPTCGLHAGPPRAHWPSALQIGQRAMQLLAAGGSREPVVEFALPGIAPASAGQPRAAATLAAARSGAQAADSERALLPSGCLQDARTLLRRFAQGAPRKQHAP